MYLKKLGIPSKIVFQLFICLIMLSCGIKYDIKKNQKTTDKIFKKEFKVNGNAFELSIDDSNFSYVFSKLKSNETIWYRLSKGKIVETKKISFKEIKFDKLNNLQSIDLNCKEDEKWDYVLFFKVGDSISNTKFINLRCLDSVKKNDIFLEYLNSIITQGKPVIW